MFSKRLRSWTSTNEKWQALEAVIVSVFISLGILAYQKTPTAIKRHALDYSHPCFFISTVGLVKLIIRSKFFESFAGLDLTPY